MSLHRLISRTALVATATAGLILPAMSPAHAAITPGAGIGVDGYGGAVGYVSGPAASYTAYLTATGGGTCTVANGAVPIVGLGSDSGNPAEPTTGGAVCHLYDAHVDYVLVATPLVGASITFYRSCTWALGIQVCTPAGVQGL